MTPTTQGVIVLVVTLATLLSGAPVAFGLGAISILFVVLFQGVDALHVVAETFYAGLNDFTLVSIPMFVMITEWRTHFRRQMNELDSKANTRAIDSLLNYETVKYFGNEQWEVSRYDESLQRWERAAVLSQTSLSALNIGQSSIIAVAVTLIMNSTDESGTSVIRPLQQSGHSGWKYTTAPRRFSSSKTGANSFSPGHLLA